MEAILDIIKSLNAEATIDLIIAVGIIAVFDIFSSLFSAIILKLFNFKKMINNNKKLLV